MVPSLGGAISFSQLVGSVILSGSVPPPSQEYVTPAAEKPQVSVRETVAGVVA